MTVQLPICALPQSVRPDADHHVSLFLGPRLLGDGLLREFPPFDGWAAALLQDGTRITLADDFGVIEDARPLLRADPDVWDAVFPGDTPVRAWETRGVAGRELQSYDVATGIGAAKWIHVLSTVFSPVAPPPPSASPVTGLMDEVRKHVPAVRETRDGMVYDESEATKQLDRMLGDETSGRDGALRLVRELHRARRFFERPDTARAQAEYRERGDERSPRLEQPQPDFHERVTLLGDQPELLRRLGLVVDLHVTDVDRLHRSTFLTARIELAEHGDLTLPTRVRCAVAGGAFVTVGRDGGDWRDGRLRVGDAKRFALLDLDPDASALKLDRFLWTVPRLAELEERGEPAHVAPPTLRAHGFSVARRGRAAELRAAQDHAQGQTDGDLVAGREPELHTEDVTRGMRVEVWDATAQAWFSLHRVRREVEVAGLRPFGVEEDGWVQTGTVQESIDGSDRVLVHETLFGWSGWSLSAPHPALSVEHTYEDGGADRRDPMRHEALVRAEDLRAADHGLRVVTRTSVAPGTLPLLRYGREYALRAWAVDLAGGSPEHTLGKPAPSGPPADLLAAAEHHLATIPALDLDDGGLGSVLRAHGAGLRARRLGAAVGAASAHALAAAVRQRVGDAPAEIRAAVLAHVRRRTDRARARLGAPSRGDRVREALTPFMSGDAALAVQPVAGWRPDALAAAAAGHLGELVHPDLLSEVLDTVTEQTPLLRWSPVDPPVLVPRRAYIEGESLRHLVVRSPVTVVPDPELGDTISVGPPEGPCERHVAPPKASQLQCELHGRFDAAMTPAATPQERLRALLAARREAGTFLDLELPSLTDPQGRETVDGVRLERPTRPDPDQTPTDLDKRVRGDALATGEYVVHDTDRVVVPYLPDPLARGVSFVFPDAGHGPPLDPYARLEGTTADFEAADQWPEVAAFRLVLEGGRPLGAEVDGTTIRLSVPPADVLRTRLSSAIDRPGLDLLGTWRMLPDALRQSPVLAEAAADGWLWALSPADEVTFVHAVPRPLQAPRAMGLRADRKASDPGTWFEGAIDLHGPSTERVDLEATWTQQEDDLAQALPDTRTHHAVASTFPVQPFEDLALLGREDDAEEVAGAPLVTHRARHEFGDTRHRVVDYRLRATTRFREYFPLPADPKDRTVVGPVQHVSIPSSARPAKPVVHQVLPLLRWEQGTEPEQPFALRRIRRSGVRLYLDRPWYSSGDGELLGVVVGRGDLDPEVADQQTSRWGSDPIWHSHGPAHSAIGLELEHVLAAHGDEREQPDRPVRRASGLPLDGGRGRDVDVLGYRPVFDPTRRLWAVDIAVDPGLAAWPFLRLAVARFQPESLEGLHLSPVVRCDFVQLPLERTTTVSRPDEHTARVVVSGPVVHRASHDDEATLAEARKAVQGSRTVRARLERRLPSVGTDLGWETVGLETLALEGFDETTLTAAWTGELELPEPVALRRPTDPAAPADWRVTVLESEHLRADSLPGEMRIAGRPTYGSRVVHLDQLEL